MNLDIENSFDKDIEKIVQDFGDHDYIRRPRVIRWLKQFGDKEIHLAIKVLKNIRYFGASNLMSMSRQIVEMVNKQFPHIKGSSIFYVPVGGAGTGAQIIARHLKNNSDIPNANIVDLLGIYRESKIRKIDVIIFLEDFSGTGNTIRDWWNTNAPIILPIGAIVIFGILVLNITARSTLEKEITTIAIQYLEEKDNILSDKSKYFGEAEKKVLVSFCEKTLCSTKYIRGYGDCGLLVAFQHGCPNNSLPILWHESYSWEALFRRRSV